MLQRLVVHYSAAFFWPMHLIASPPPPPTAALDPSLDPVEIVSIIDDAEVENFIPPIPLLTTASPTIHLLLLES